MRIESSQSSTGSVQGHIVEQETDNQASDTDSMQDFIVSG